MPKNKIPKIDTEVIAEAARRVGLVTMSAALTLCMLELPDEAKRAILPIQPAPAWAEAGQHGGSNNPIRREREETAPHFISYSEVQRTPARSGRS
jgi:hypothetical protein